MSLLPVAEAQSRFLATATALDAELVSLDRCAGRWLAEDVLARRDQPWADLSAMDGYAVRAADVAESWTVTGESAAGDACPPRLKPGEAARIFTGAPLPEGADAVVMQEDVARDGATATLTTASPPRPGAFVRPAGSDFRAGNVLIERGTRLTAAHVALAAIGGHNALPVPRKPRVAILSTGSELVEPGRDIAPGKLPSSNAVMLAAMFGDLPCDVEQLGIVPDSLDRLTEAFRQAATADIIVTSGGASVGDHDLVRPALEAAGGSVDFWRIAMRPGKPLIAGTLGAARMIGLPGNPVSTFTTATLFLLPVVRSLGGDPAPLPATTRAQLGHGVAANDSIRDAYLRGVLADGVVTVFDNQDSASLRTLAAANCFILHPAGAGALAVGSAVGVIRIG